MSSIRGINMLHVTSVALMVGIVLSMVILGEYKLGREQGEVYQKPKGNYIGMSATIIYLQETKQLDSISVDIERLIQIQDSLNIEEREGEL